MSTADLDDRGVIVACPACGQKNRLVYERLDDAVRCGHCKRTLPPPGAPIDIGRTADFDRLVAAASIPVVVDYWAPWCGPCRMVAPGVEQAARELAGRLKVVKVNVDDAPGVSARFGVQGIPTLLILRDGAAIARQVGALPADRLVSWVRGVVDHAA
jgi:thioredoxin 2